MKRVAVVGVTGAGKSTFALELSRRLGVACVELDALYWQPNWTKPDQAALRACVSSALAGEGWVAEGNYGVVRDLIWPVADTLVWLDYELPLILLRLLRRTVRRSLSRELLWGTNRERFFPQFFSRDSLFLWALQTHPRYRREYPALLADAAHQHLHVVRLPTPAAASAWLRSVPG